MSLKVYLFVEYVPEGKKSAIIVQATSLKEAKTKVEPYGSWSVAKEVTDEVTYV